MLAWGWRVHQARIRARLQVASLTPWGTRLPRGCLPTWPQPGSRHEQPVPTAGWVVASDRLEVAAVGEGVVQGQDRDAAGGIAQGGVAQLPAGPAHRRALRSRWALALQEAGGAAAATAGGLGQGAGRPGLAVGPRLGVGGLQPRPDRAVVGRFGPGGQRSPLGAEGPRRLVLLGGGVAASDGRGLRELAGRLERARAVSGSGLGGQAGDLAGVALEAFQHGQHGQGDGGGDGLGDQIRLGVGDVAADGGQGAGDDQQPAIAGALGAAAGAADDPEHAVDGRPVGHHRDGGGLPPAVAGLDAQGVQRGGRDRIGADGDDHGHGHPQLEGDSVQPGHPASGRTRRAGRWGGWPPGRADRPGAVALGVGEGLH